jgi:hypothetical protein
VKLRPVVEKTAEVMQFRDIIDKEDLSARASRIVLNVYFKPDAPAIAAIEMKRNPAPCLGRFSASSLKLWLSSEFKPKSSCQAKPRPSRATRCRAAVFINATRPFSSDITAPIRSALRIESRSLRLLSTCESNSLSRFSADFRSVTFL